MILTLTLNPCIDKTIYLDQLEVGSYNRVKNTRQDSAGKGLNVGIVLNNLKESVRCMGFNFKSNGYLLEQFLDAHKVPYSFLMAEGSIRTNIKLFDQSCQVMTEVNEAGPFVSQETVDQLLADVDAALCTADILVMSGSIPPGVPSNIYQRLIRMANEKQVKTVLDAAGEPLILGLQEKPFLIKPNTLEFEQAFRDDIDRGMDTLEIARRVIENGTSYVCLSMGEKGAMLIDREHAYQAPPLPLEPRGLTGAGDSIVAGLCYAIRQNLGSEDMLRYAMAAAGGSIRQEGTLLACESDVQELLPLVEIQTLS